MSSTASAPAVPKLDAIAALPMYSPTATLPTANRNEVDQRTHPNVAPGNLPSAANGAAKAAHLLAGLAASLGTAPRVRLRLPLHWQVGDLRARGVGGRGRPPDRGHRARRRRRRRRARPRTRRRTRRPSSSPERRGLGHPAAPVRPAVRTAAPSFPVEDLTPALREQPDSPPAGRRSTGRGRGGRGRRGVDDGRPARPGHAARRRAGRDDRVLTCLPWTPRTAGSLGSSCRRSRQPLGRPRRAGWRRSAGRRRRSSGCAPPSASVPRRASTSQGCPASAEVARPVRPPCGTERASPSVSP